mmetsp:Transcript_29076/g.94937  ORF Transcript_29076/g.94937 Transcript_29076/m.94937 type:complete len:89 (+) Transcript_29076:30-296(+)
MPPRQPPSSALANRPAGAPPAGATAANRRLRSSGNSAGANSRMLRMYTDESPGLRISPVTVLIMSTVFIFFVALLHTVSKVYQYTTRG